MTGIELSRRFFFEEGLPRLKAQFSPIAARCAAGLISGGLPSGCGSEVMGFDDSHSHDHNWGPRFFLILGTPVRHASIVFVSSSICALQKMAVSRVFLSAESAPRPCKTRKDDGADGAA